MAALREERDLSARAVFEREFGSLDGARLARAPGRVNLIGEHIDTHDLAVLPIAIQRETRVLFRPRADARVRLANRAPRFERREFELARDIAPRERGDWANYPQAAAQALVRRLGPMRGVDAVVCGDVPPASGLSSSAALVVASALALLAANEREVELLQLAELLAEGERYVGTESGGMDQAASLAGRRGFALEIRFRPLRVEAIPIPASWRFVVAHSLVLADKSGRAQAEYNARRAQSAEALRIVAAHPSLRAATPTYPALLASHGSAALLEIASSTLGARHLARFRHVVTEADRVASACSALRTRDSQRFGELMDASHASLRDDLEVSCPELDLVCELARAHGARGARLTGAGFGGCAVALCDAERADELMSALRERFYARRELPSAIEEPLFIAEASDGARVE